MRKFVLVMSLLAAGSIAALGQGRTIGSLGKPSAAFCFSSTLSGWVPMAGAASGTALGYAPTPTPMFGQNGSSWYPLQCDSSGNLQVGTVSYWVLMGLNTASNFAFVQNVEDYTAYDIPTTVIANQVCVRPNIADNTATNNYSFALYSSTGAKVLDTGAIHGNVLSPATVPTCVALSTAATLAPGRYYASFTTNCSTACAALATYGLAQLTPLANKQGAATAGGASNATITPPADVFASVAGSPWFELHK